MSFYNINCPNCNGNKYSVFKNPKFNTISKDQLLTIFKASSDSGLISRVVSCDNCNLKFINPRLDAEDIEDSYSNSLDETFSSQNLYRIETFKDTLIKLVKSKIINTEKHKKILDIGCASGSFLVACKELGFQPTGIEPNKKLVEYGKENYKVDIKQGILNSDSFKNEKFDIITLWDVIEHLSNPSQTINIAKDLLNKEGLLIVNYPDSDTSVAKLLGNKWPFWLDVHLIYFSKLTMKNFLMKRGFKVILIKNHWQKLSIKYIFERASKIISLFKIFLPIINFLNLNNFKIKYYIGQRMVISIKSE